MIVVAGEMEHRAAEYDIGERIRERHCFHRLQTKILAGGWRQIRRQPAHRRDGLRVDIHAVTS